jgi:hypothetical protein
MRTWSWWDIAYTAVRRGNSHFGWTTWQGVPDDPTVRLEVRRERRALDRAQRRAERVGGGSGLLGGLIITVGWSLVAVLVLLLLFLADRGHLPEWMISVPGLACSFAVVLWMLGLVRGRRGFGPAENTRLRLTQRYRVKLYARAARSPTPERCTQLAADLKLRMREWGHRLKTGKRLSSRSPFMLAEPYIGPLVVGVVGLFYAQGTILRKLDPADSSMMSCAAPLAAVMLAVIIPLRLLLLRRRLSHALRTRSCPNCRYDLGSLPEAIDPALLGGERVGPERCPECGSRWPLVPPPVDDEPTKVRAAGPATAS